MKDDIKEALQQAQAANIVVAPSVKPEARPTDLVLASVQSSVQPRAAVQPREVVTRLSTSGGKHWGINVGRFNSRYQAERALLKTALNEMETLDGSLRSVVKRPKGFEANFNGLTRERAETACRRLQARNVTCFMMGPG
jgi:D-alanyl-D-alanine carboxypeptidase